MALNPGTDDLGSRFLTGGGSPKRGRQQDPDERRWDKDVIGYHERVESEYRVLGIYGRQDEPLQFRGGRRVS